ncbi:MAG: FAD:protein FMN transferase [Opitutaceae bacterium]
MMVSPSNSRQPAAPIPAGPVAPLHKVEWKALGTSCAIQFACAEQARADAFGQAAMAWVAQFEQRYSRFRPDSLVSRINAAAGRSWVEVDAEMEQMLDLSGSLHFMTQGILDVTALPLLRLWNFKGPDPRVPTETEVAAARRCVGWGKVQRKPGAVFLPEAGMSIDFGGWGKEFAVDAVAQIGKDHGLTALLVDFGHDLKAVGQPPGRPAWHVGLENPASPGATWGSIAVIDKGVASSGDYLRGVTIGGRRFGHIVDPRTGWPVSNGCTQATVVAASCLQAGILSTTSFVLGAEAGLRFIQDTFGAEGCLLTQRARHQTRGFFRYEVT